MESDTEILDRLFSMFDKTGNDQINYKEFVAGLAPLCHGNVEEKLARESGFSLFSFLGNVEVETIAASRSRFSYANSSPADTQLT